MVWHSLGVMSSTPRLPGEPDLDAPPPQLKHIRMTVDGDGVCTVVLDRPGKRNALSMDLWFEVEAAFRWADVADSVRVVVLQGNGPAFCAGIDRMALASLVPDVDDAGRRSERLRRSILALQRAFSSMEACRKPSVAAVHGACVGAGVDLITACDLRYCSSDAFFSIKEVDLGIVADCGTLQRAPSIMPATDLRELALTGRQFDAREAYRLHLVNRIYETREALYEGATGIAREIAARSPLAVRGIKRMLLFQRDHSVADGLDYVATWNSAQMLSTDVHEAMGAGMERRQPLFSNL